MPAAATSTASPERRRRRIAAWLTGTLAGLLAALLVCEALGWSFLRPLAQREASRRLGTEVTLAAPMRLQLIGQPRLRLGGLRVGAARDSGVPFLVDATDVEALWRWRDVWRAMRGAPLYLVALRAERLEAHLRRDAQGHASWQFKTPDAGKPDADRPPPRAGWLEVRDGRIHLDDAPSRLQLEIRATLDDGDAGARPPGGLFLSAEGRYRGLPAQGRMRAPRPLDMASSLAEPPDRPNPLAFEIAFGDARIGFDGQVQDITGLSRFEGNLKVAGASLATVGAPFGVTLPSTPKFSLAGRLVRDGDAWQLAARDARIGSSRLAGDFRFDTAGDRPRLTGSLSGSRLALADLAPSIGGGDAAAQPAAAGARPSGRVLPASDFDLPSLTRMEADVNVALDELELGTKAIAEVKPLKGHIELKGGVLTVSSLQARSAGGTIEGRTQLDSSGKPAAWAADLRWNGIDLARFLPVARSGDTPGGSYIGGLLRGELQLRGRGNSTAAILGSLAGNARAVVRDGHVSHLALELGGLDLAQALGVKLRGDRQLPLHCAVVAVTAEAGRVKPQAAVFDTRDSTITLDGQVDLAHEQMDLKAVVHPKDFSLFTLRSPLRVGGSFAKPDIGIEKAPIAGRVIAGAALAAINPLAALVPFIDPGDDDGGGGCARLARESRTHPNPNPSARGNGR